MREKKPMNDVTDHYAKHVGLPSEKVDMKKLPKPLRWIGYFLACGLIVAACLLIIGIIMTYV